MSILYPILPRLQYKWYRTYMKLRGHRVFMKPGIDKPTYVSFKVTGKAAPKVEQLVYDMGFEEI